MAVERIKVKVSPGALRDRRFVLRGIRQAMRRALARSARKLEAEVKRQAPRDTGALRDSARIIVGRTPDRESVEVKMLLYGVYQSEGFLGKGKGPPPGVLDGWVRRKLGISDRGEVRRVAFAVGRKLAKIGGPGKEKKQPNRFIDRAVRRIGPELRRDFREEVKRLRLRKER